MPARSLLRIVASAALVPLLAGAAPARPRDVAVVIENMTYTPASLALRPGDRVTWTNRDLVPHTTTARDGRFDSKAIAAGASYTWVASGKGPLAYACAYHPAMVARLVLP